MLIVHGIYRFCPKRVSFRNDYCLSCKAQRRTVEIRTFNMWHIFWIPLIPLGFHKRSKCVTCGSDPHYNKIARRPLMWVGLVALIIFALAFWVNPVEKDMPTLTWVFRIGSPILAILTLRDLIQTRNDKSLNDLRATVSPSTDTKCPFCNVQLMMGAEWSCPQCGIVRE